MKLCFEIVLFHFRNLVISGTNIMVENSISSAKSDVCVLLYHTSKSVITMKGKFCTVFLATTNKISTYKRIKLFNEAGSMYKRKSPL